MTIPQVLSLQPDYVAVRGAACRRERTGDLDAALVRQLHGLRAAGWGGDATLVRQLQAVVRQVA